MRVLDLFCGAGGAGMGYYRAGFVVAGVDHAPQPDYPFEFYEYDALDFVAERGHEYDVIHASPPCQAHTPMSNRWRGTGSVADDRINMIGAVREALEATGRPYVIENVPGAKQHLRSPIMLHGGHFGLKVWRPRWFEISPSVKAPPKAPKPIGTVSIYGRPRLGPNDHRWLWKRADGSRLLAATPDEARAAMEMPWADWGGISQAIPPAYTEYVGRQLAAVLQQEVHP